MPDADEPLHEIEGHHVESCSVSSAFSFGILTRDDGRALVLFSMLSFQDP